MQNELPSMYCPEIPGTDHINPHEEQKVKHLIIGLDVLHSNTVLGVSV